MRAASPRASPWPLGARAAEVKLVPLEEEEALELPVMSPFQSRTLPSPNQCAA
jgi:hypothetical protein